MGHSQQKCYTALIYSVCAASLILAALPSWAESTESQSQSALRLWRNVALYEGIARHDYREPDPLGRVNPLNSETGPIPTTELKLRWRGQLAQALPELVVQTHVSYTQGQTDYRGYLQQGVTLAPYNARTGNTLQALSLRLGLPLNAFSRQQWAHHVVPYVEQSRNRWQRNLAQYGETFAWQTTTLGAMALWPLADLGLPEMSSFTVEADVSVARTRRPSMSAPALGFVADLGEASEHHLALGLYYAVTPTWMLGLRYQAQRTNFGTSASVAGLEYPGASRNHQCWLVSIGTHF